MRKYFLFIILILSLIMFISFCSKNNNSNDQEDESNNKKEKEEVTGKNSDTGKEAPDFILTNHNGEQVSLSDFENQYVHVELAADWCPNCHAQARYHGELKEKLKSRGIDNFVTLVVLFEDKSRNAPSQDLLGTWASDYGFDYVVSDENKEVLESYPFSGTPTNVLILPNGNIAYSWSGNPGSALKFIDILKQYIPAMFQ